MGIIYILFYKSISPWFWNTKKWWLHYSPTMMHFSGGSIVIADGDCSHEIKTLSPWKNSYDQTRQHIKKQRRYFANKGLSSSHVWMWVLDCEESWAPKNWCIWTVVWRRLLRVTCTARRSNQSILKEISPGISLEGMMLKLKLQYFGHLMRRVNLLEKTLMLGGIGGRRRRGQQRMRWLDGITDSMDVSLSDSGSWWWTERPGVLRFMGLQRVGHDWATELNWTEMG